MDTSHYPKSILIRRVYPSLSIPAVLTTTGGSGVALSLAAFLLLLEGEASFGGAGLGERTTGGL